MMHSQLRNQYKLINYHLHLRIFLQKLFLRILQIIHILLLHILFDALHLLVEQLLELEITMLGMLL